MGFEVDEHEPQHLVRLLDLAINDLEMKPLNVTGWADYRYTTNTPCFCHKSYIFNCERKTWADLCAGVDEIEIQLAKQLDRWPGVHHRLYIEGVAEPAMKGVLLYTKDQGRNQMRAGLRGEQQGSYKRIINWLHQAGKYWEIVHTPTMDATAITIAANYEADQEDEESHHTFHRMFKEYNYKYNPHAAFLLNTSGTVRMGTSQAEALANKFGTYWKAIHADPEEWFSMSGIGEGTARRFMNGLGRTDV